MNEELMYRSFDFMRINETFTSEDVKLANADLPASHYNSWGSIVQFWVDSHWCAPTDERRKAKSKQARHRKLKVYRSLVYKE